MLWCSEPSVAEVEVIPREGIEPAVSSGHVKSSQGPNAMHASLARDCLWSHEEGFQNLSRLESGAFAFTIRYRQKTSFLIIRLYMKASVKGLCKSLGLIRGTGLPVEVLFYQGPLGQTGVRILNCTVRNLLEL